jgi:hypothetical protein
MSERYDQLQDDEISALYRETRAVEPPAWLDRHVLAAANAAAVSRPAPAKQPVGRRMTRWTVPLALAATVVLTVGVVRMVRESGQFESSLRLERMQSPDKPAAETGALGARQAERSLAYPLPEAAPPVAPAAPAAPVSSVESVTSPPTPASPAQIGDERSPVPSSVPAAASPAPPAKPTARKRETMVSAEPEKAGETKVAPALEERKAGGASDRLSRRSPEQWLQEIAELRRRGRTAEADTSLAEFRRRYPDHPLDKLSAPR